MMYNAKSPVSLIGSQTMLNVTQVDNLVQKLASLGMPMFVSGMARGLLSKEELNIFRHQRKKALQEADLVLLAGVPCDFRLGYGRQINRKAEIISINRSRSDLYLNRKPTLAIQADPGYFFSSLPENQLENKVDFDTWMKLNSQVLRHMTTGLNSEPEVYVEEEQKEKMKNFPEISGKKVLVYSLGIEGQDLARWFMRHGAEVTASDTRTEQQLQSAGVGRC